MERVGRQEIEDIINTYICIRSANFCRWFGR